MRLRPRTVLVVTFVAALLVFAAVQDRVTASGARQYVAQQRLAMLGLATPVTIEDEMAPAIRQSLRDALAWAGLVAVLGSLFLLPRSRVTGRGSGDHRE